MLELEIAYMCTKYDDCSLSRSRHMVGAHQNLMDSRHMTTPLSGMVCHPWVSDWPKPFYVFATRQCRRMHCVFGLPSVCRIRSSVCSFVRSSGQIMLPWYLMKGLYHLNKIYRECSLAFADVLITFWESKVKVATGRRDAEGIHVDTVALKSIF